MATVYGSATIQHAIESVNKNQPDMEMISSLDAKQILQNDSQTPVISDMREPQITPNGTHTQLEHPVKEFNAQPMISTNDFGLKNEASQGYNASSTIPDSNYMSQKEVTIEFFI